MTLLRLWCGRKRHSHWLASRDELCRVALAKGLAFEDARGRVTLGPLTWIEAGYRPRAKARTQSLGRATSLGE